jgi:hypothetical protein
MGISKYLQTGLITFIIGILVVLIVNLSIDPYSVWNFKCLNEFSCRKTEAGGKIYLTKVHQWRNSQNFNIVILGNSRTEMGIDPASRKFKSKYAYNLSIRGSGIETQLKYLVNFLKIHKPNQIIWGLDFLNFVEVIAIKPEVKKVATNRFELPYDISGSKNPNYLGNDINNRFKTLLSLDAIKSSVKTIFKQRSSVNYLNENGFNNALGFVPVVENEGANSLFEHDELMLSKKIKGKKLVLSIDNGKLRWLKEIVELSRSNRVELKLFINPYHKRYIEVLSEEGQLDLFLEWKEQLVKDLDLLSYFNDFRLYDFSGSNIYTSETVPLRKGVHMKWFWEPSHYKKELGDVIIEHLNNGDSSEFLITPNNITHKTTLERTGIEH